MLQLSTITIAVLLLVFVCANGQAPSNTGDTMSLASLFIQQNAANAQKAAKLLEQVRDGSMSVADKQLAVQVGIQQVRLPLIEEFKKAAGDPALAVSTNSNSNSNNTNGTHACVQKTQEEALQELAKIPWDKTLAEYRVLCNKEPTNDILCFEKLRQLKFEDYQALMQAKEQGITLNLPCVPKTKAADYDVGDPFNVTSSGLPRQLQGALKLKALQEKLSKLAALTATTTAQTTQATTTTTTTTGTTTTVSTNPGDTTASTASTTTTTTTTTTAAPTTTAAARPTIRRVGGALQVPPGQPNAGRTIYFFPGESSTSQQCTGGCADIWIPLNGERVADWALDPAAACAGSSANGLSAAASSAAQSGVQLTCGNRLLYLFTDDRNPGERKGLSFTGGLPFVLA